MIPFQKYDLGLRQAHSRERADCTVWALATATGVPYAEAHQLLTRAGRRDRHRFDFRKWMTRCGGRALGHRFTLVKRSGTLGRFIRTHPTGTYLVAVPRHVFTVHHGKVLDAQEQGELRRVKRAWRVTKEEAGDRTEEVSDGLASDPDDMLAQEEQPSIEAEIGAEKVPGGVA